MIRVLLAEDEAPIREDLRALLESTQKVVIVGEAEDGDTCLRLIEETSPDALLLDVRMPGASGLAVARAAAQRSDPPLIVFITAYAEYAMDAFEVNAVDYLLKPFDAPRIHRLVGKLEQSLAHKRDYMQRLLTALEQWEARLTAEQTQPALQKIPVKDYKEGTIRLLSPADILFARREGDRVHIVTKDKEYPTYYSVDQLDKQLSRSGFLRASSGALVNVDAIEHIIPNGDGTYDLILTNRAVITVTRRRAKTFLPLMKLES